ncbi:GLUG motif-containing protein [Halodesulfurarchaeum formicicum]|uniref:GLUG domain protein n=1 Tax=Halodesulfurarchaeum formicicum TaxID=1873524 RepID=A0A1J1AD51_9EURY|nr:GLUG motif-containing protein [Halodesulfurarchaeum formicicum]APE95688.1 GLUG domain protein [Halodesulfurarchaeum formicicum]
MKLRAIFLSALMVVSIVASGIAFGAGIATASVGNEAPELYAGGNGTATNPYQIANWTHLNNTRENLDANFTLVNDLNESTDGYESVASGSANGGDGFAPIGNSSTPFTGTFDGDGTTISDLSITNPDADPTGLFGVVGTDGTVEYLTLVDATVTAGDGADGSMGESGGNSGGLVGKNTGMVRHTTVNASTVSGGDGGNSSSNYMGGTGGSAGGVTGVNAGTIQNSTANSVNVSAGEGGSGTSYPGSAGNSGGLVGDNSGTVSESRVTGTIGDSGFNTAIGGLVGSNDGTVTTSFVNISVSASGDYDAVGGLVGVSNGVVSRSSATGNVTGTSFHVGGLVGYNPNGVVTDSNATADVDGSQRVGGLVGLNQETVTDSYATGDVIGDSAVGGLIGSHQGTVNLSYATGSVNGSGDDVGGLVGHNNEATVNTSYATGSVNSGGKNVGGLVGRADGNYNDNVVAVSYATGSVNGSTNVGALVGKNHGGSGGTAYLNNTYAVGSVSGDSSVGGLVGLNVSDATVTDGYWDVKTTTQPSSAGSAVGLTTTKMTGRDALDAGNMDGLNPSTWDTHAVETAKGYVFPYPTLTVNSQIPAPNQTLYAAGDGSESNPYEIANWYHLNNTRENTGENFTLINNLNDSTDGYDMVANASANSDKGFEPIGSLSGTFDGNDKSMEDLTINRSGEDAVGLFGTVGGTVQDLNLDDVNIKGGNNTGGVVGYHGGPVTIKNVSVSGNVTGIKRVGGVVGDNNGRITNATSAANVSGATSVGGLVGRHSNFGEYTIENSTANGNVELNENATEKLTGDPFSFGGLVGYNDGGKINHSNATSDVIASDAGNVGGLIGLTSDGTVNHTYATGSVDAGDNVGGLIGLNMISSVTNSYAESEVNGSLQVAGLIGVNGGGLVNESYATGDVSATSDTAGGLIGLNTDWDSSTLHNATVTNTYATGNVSADGKNLGGLVGKNLVDKGGKSVVNKSYAVGEVDPDGSASGNVSGLIGANSGTVENAYWDTEKTGQDSSAGGTGLTTSEMIGANALDNMDALESPPWETVTESTAGADADGYPILTALDTEPQILTPEVKADTGDDGRSADSGGGDGELSTDYSIEDQTTDSTTGDGRLQVTINEYAIGDTLSVTTENVETGSLTVEQVDVSFDMGTNSPNEMTVQAGTEPPSGVPKYTDADQTDYVSVDVDGNLKDRVSGGSIMVRVAPDRMPDDPSAVEIYHAKEETWDLTERTYLGDRRYKIHTSSFSTFVVVVKDATKATTTATTTPTTTETVTPTSTQTVTPTTTETMTTTETSTPGFGTIVSLVSLLGAVLLARRR